MMLFINIIALFLFCTVLFTPINAQSCDPTYATVCTVADLQSGACVSQYGYCGFGTSFCDLSLYNSTCAGGSIATLCDSNYANNCTLSDLSLGACVNSLGACGFGPTYCTNSVYNIFCEPNNSTLPSQAPDLGNHAGYCNYFNPLLKGKSAQGSVEFYNRDTGGSFGEFFVSNMHDGLGNPWNGHFQAVVYDSACSDPNNAPLLNISPIPSGYLNEIDEMIFYGSIRGGSGTFYASVPFPISTAVNNSVIVLYPDTQQEWFCCDIQWVGGLGSCASFVPLTQDPTEMLGSISITQNSPIIGTIMDLTSSSYTNQPVMAYLTSVPCNVAEGGSNFDLHFGSYGESVELWYHLFTNAVGGAHYATGRPYYMKNSHQAYASSVVIRDPSSNVPALCCDIVWTSQLGADGVTAANQMLLSPASNIKNNLFLLSLVMVLILIVV